MAFRVEFSFEDRAWVATLDESSSLSWLAPSPTEVLQGLMALAPTPSGILEEDEIDDEDDPRGHYDQYIQELILSGAASGCTCDKPGCHCDGVGDLSPLGYSTCACCMADCPDAHDQGNGTARNLLEPSETSCEMFSVSKR
jgi:hypothetical protein